MEGVHVYEVNISDSFWDNWNAINLDALYYQWDQLENTRCIDNFRIAAGTRQGFREGWFFQIQMHINGWMQQLVITK